MTGRTTEDAGTLLGIITESGDVVWLRAVGRTLALGIDQQQDGPVISVSLQRDRAKDIVRFLTAFLAATDIHNPV